MHEMLSARLEGKLCTKAYLTIFWDHLLNYSTCLENGIANISTGFS